MSINVVTFGTGMITSGLAVQTFLIEITKFTLLSCGVFVSMAFTNALRFIGADYSCVDAIGTGSVLLTGGTVGGFAATWCAFGTVLPVSRLTDTLSRRIFNPVLRMITQCTISR